MFHMKQSPPGGFVTVSGLQTHVVVSGGGPTVVLCGGLGSDWFNWAALIEDFVRLAQPLKARFAVVTETHHHAMTDQPVSVAALVSELV